MEGLMFLGHFRVQDFHSLLDFHFFAKQFIKGRTKNLFANARNIVSVHGVGMVILLELCGYFPHSLPHACAMNLTCSNHKVDFTK